jgi:hypothetical protein
MESGLGWFLSEVFGGFNWESPESGPGLPLEAGKEGLL